MAKIGYNPVSLQVDISPAKQHQQSERIAFYLLTSELCQCGLKESFTVASYINPSALSPKAGSVEEMGGGGTCSVTSSRKSELTPPKRLCHLGLL